MTTDPLNEGMAALQAGDRERARALLEEATRLQPENETAWYYRAAAEDDPAMRRTCLERVLIINPGNERAREVLERMGPAPAAQEAPRAAGGTTSFEWATNPPPVSGVPGVAAVGGIALPVSIPGAPERVGIVEMLRDGFRLFMRGVAVLQRRPGVVEEELAEATWWRVWLMVGWATLMSGLLNAVGAVLALFFGTVLGRGLPFSTVIVTLIVLIVSVPAGLIVDYAGAYASHWYATQQGRRVPLLQHAYLTMLHWLPASVLGALLSALSTVIGLGGLGSLISLALNLYALYLLGLAYRALHRFSAPSQEWVTVVVLFVAVAVAGVIGGVVIGLLTAPLAIGAALTGR